MESASVGKFNPTRNSDGRPMGSHALSERHILQFNSLNPVFGPLLLDVVHGTLELLRVFPDLILILLDELLVDFVPVLRSFGSVGLLLPILHVSFDEFHPKLFVLTDDLG